MSFAHSNSKGVEATSPVIIEEWVDASKGNGGKLGLSEIAIQGEVNMTFKLIFQ